MGPFNSNTCMATLQEIVDNATHKLSSGKKLSKSLKKPWKIQPHIYGGAPDFMWHCMTTMKDYLTDIINNWASTDEEIQAVKDQLSGNSKKKKSKKRLRSS